MSENPYKIGDEFIYSGRIIRVRKLWGKSGLYFEGTEDRWAIQAYDREKVLGPRPPNVYYPRDTALFATPERRAELFEEQRIAKARREIEAEIGRLRAIKQKTSSWPNIKYAGTPDGEAAIAAAREIMISSLRPGAATEFMGRNAVVDGLDRRHGKDHVRLEIEGGGPYDDIHEAENSDIPFAGATWFVDWAVSVGGVLRVGLTLTFKNSVVAK